MLEDSMSNTTPQFGTAEYERKTGGDYCRFCNQSIVGRYYRVNGAMACNSCADRAQRETPADSHAAFLRGLLLGIAAAILGLILYAAFEIMTGIIIGYASLAVGFLVGKAIMVGSKGIGGRRYQIAAVLLTYAAVSMAAIPVAISQFSKEQSERKEIEEKRQSSTDKPQASQQNQPAQAPSTDAQAGQQSEQKPVPKMGIGAVLVEFILIGLASPFLELQNPVYGLIGLVILFVGIRIAWRITAVRPLQIEGPYDNPAPLSP
jgi:predicted lipid-binding transport protein (Tim44 family)